MSVLAELSDNGKFVKVTFQYSPDRVTKVKRVTRSFTPREKGGPFWRVPKDLTACRRLREQFKDELELGPKLQAWGREEVDKERNLKDLSQQDDAELVNVPAPLLDGVEIDGEHFALRPYQRADAAFMAEGKFVNANQPGSGKTAEHICAIFEADLAWGQHLVFAPITSLELVWQREIENLYEGAGLDPPTVLTGDTPASRKKAAAYAKQLADEEMSFWLVVNPHMAQKKRRVKSSHSGGDVRSADFEDYLVCPELAEVEWDSMVVDEFHLCGLSNPTTQAAEGINYIRQKVEPAIVGCMSGTPMGGKPIKLWGALHFVDPESFSARWTWARHWLVINKNDFGSSIEGIIPGREEEFYDHLKKYLVRRTKREVLPGLPEKNRINVWCDMTPKQQEQYDQFHSEAEVRLDEAEGEGRLTATSILAEFTRLKQFASAFCSIKKKGWDDHLDRPELVVKQTVDSGKFEQLVERLKEENVIVSAGKDDDDPKCALIFTQFTGVVEAVMEVLKEHKVPATTITGATTGKQRKERVEEFQEQKGKNPPRVMVMNTQAGGTTLTLTRADSVHMLDETWDPDNQEQAEDRAHRGDEKTMEKDEVRIYYYRTRGTIEEYIRGVVRDKALTNKTILDLRRRMLQRTSEEVGV